MGQDTQQDTCWEASGVESHLVFAYKTISSSEETFKENISVLYPWGNPKGIMMEFACYYCVYSQHTS